MDLREAASAASLSEQHGYLSPLNALCHQPFFTGLAGSSSDGAWATGVVSGMSSCSDQTGAEGAPGA